MHSVCYGKYLSARMQNIKKEKIIYVLLQGTALMSLDREYIIPGSNLLSFHFKIVECRAI